MTDEELKTAWYETLAYMEDEKNKCEIVIFAASIEYVEQFQKALEEEIKKTIWKQ